MIKAKHVVLIIAAALFIFTLLYLPCETGYPKISFKAYRFVWNFQMSYSLYWPYLAFEWAGLAVASSVAFYIAATTEKKGNGE